MYPGVEVMKNLAKDMNDYEDCGDLQTSKADISLSEKLVHENDSLYEMHDQVCTNLMFLCEISDVV